MSSKERRSRSTHITWWIDRAAAIASVFAIVVGSLVLVGWYCQIDWLKGILPSLVTMKANTALLFVVTGCALWLLKRPASRWQRKMGQVLGLVPLVIGLLTLGEYGLGWHPGIDQLLVQESGGPVGTSHLGRMSPYTAIAFVGVSAALWFTAYRSRRYGWWSQGFALLTTLIAWQALVGYLYNVKPLYGIPPYTQMALHTAVTFLVLSIGILSVHAHQGFMQLVTNDRVSGFVARRLLLAVIITPLGLGWLITVGIRSQLFDSILGLSILILSSTVIFILLIWRTVDLLDHQERERQRAETARQQTAQDLQRANERFELAAAAVRGLIYEWDPVTDRIERTQGLFDITGFTPAEAEPTTAWWRDRVHPDDRAKLANLTAKNLADIDTYTIEYRVLHRDGHYRYVWDRALLERDAFGQVVRVVGCTLEVTDRRQAEAALRESEARFRLMADSAPVLIWMAGTDQRCHYFNRSWLDFTGRTLEQERGYGWTDGIHPDDYPACLECYTTAFEARESFEMEYRLRRFDGEYRWVQDTGIPLHTPDGSFTGYISCCIDVTTLKRAETTQTYLAESSKILASSLDYQTTLSSVAQLAIPHLADICAVTIVQDGIPQLLAVSCLDPEKERLLDALRQTYPLLTSARHGIMNVLRTGKSELYPIVAADMLVEAAQSPEQLSLLQRLSFQSGMIVPLAARGRTLGVISFYITTLGRHYTPGDLELAEELARRAAMAADNAELYQAAQRDRAQAEAANRSKDEFLAMLSHELRTPLNSVLGWTHMLRTRNLDATTITRALEAIDRNSRSLAELIEDLLDVSRIISGKLRLTLAPTDLWPIVEAVVESIGPTALAKDIQLQVVPAAMLSRSQPILVYGDPSRLQQVVWNLLSNAVKFTPSGGRIKIGLTLGQVATSLGLDQGLRTIDDRPHTTQYAELTVADTGIGIAADFLPHVFDRFRQADSSASRQHGGLGLGLALVRYLIDIHAGSVEVESPGHEQGTTFTVLLPLITTETSIASQASPQSVTFRSKTFHNTDS